MTRGMLTCLSILCAGVVSAAPIPEGTALAPATDKQREQAQQNLKAILLAMHNSIGEVQPNVPLCFPGDIADKKGKALLSWRVQLLPYLEQGDLYKKFALDEPWDSETNKPLIAMMPKVFAPVRVKSEEGHTFTAASPGTGRSSNREVKSRSKELRTVCRIRSPSSKPAMP